MKPNIRKNMRIYIELRHKNIKDTKNEKIVSLVFMPKYVKILCKGIAKCNLFVIMLLSVWITVYKHRQNVNFVYRTQVGRKEVRPYAPKSVRLLCGKPKNGIT